MKKFETPEVEVVKFAVQDIITESSEGEPELPPLGTRMGTNCF